MSGSLKSGRSRVGGKTTAVNPALAGAVRPAYELDALLRGVRRRNPADLGRAISLVESLNPSDRGLAAQLLEQCRQAGGNALRVAISGSPGVGKSTLIDALGANLLESGKRVAVLAVDPSSSRSGGSILGDKTRMPRLAASADAFVRPSPSGGILGGVGRFTRPAITVCEAAGFDVIIIETVGVGQSETAVREMSDHFLLLALSGAGDELQGIKRGILEAADSVAVTKADGTNADAARNAAARLKGALGLFPPEEGWSVPVLVTSALDETGLDELWEAITAHSNHARRTGLWESRRAEQRVRWFRDELLARRSDELMRSVDEFDDVVQAVREGSIHPFAAVERLV